MHRVEPSGAVEVGRTTGTSFTVTGLAPDTTYTFAVTATDGAGNTSPPSPPLEVRTAAGPTAGCHVTYHIANSWPGGFGAQVTIANRGAEPINGWRLTWDFPLAGQKVSQGWAATWRQEGSRVTADNASWNGRLAAGASTTIGFNGTWSGDNPKPASFSLNGTRCTG